MIRHHCLWILFIFTIVSKLSAQELKFNYYSIEKGLSQSVVNCLFIDSKGFLWVGTQNGLNRFNGYQFEVFTHSPTDSTSISDNWIYAITEDKAGDLYIGTKVGLCKFNYAQHNFSFPDYRHELPLEINNVVYGLWITTENYLLINTPPFLTLMNLNTNTIRSFRNTIAYDPAVSDQTIPVIEDKQGRIWVGSSKGLARFDRLTGEFKNFNSENGLLTNSRITALFCDKNGTLWVGTQKGLNYMLPSEDFFHPILHQQSKQGGLSADFIRTITQDYKGQLWIGTDLGGLFKLEFSSDSKLVFSNFTSSNSGLSHDVVYSLLTDKSNNLHIGTLNGLNIVDLKPKKFNLYRKESGTGSVNLLDNLIGSVYKDNSEILWIGNWGKGLNLFDRKSGKVEHYTSSKTGRYFINNDYVHTIFCDHQDRIWIGTRNGLMIFNKKTKSFDEYRKNLQNYSFPSIEEHRIFCMIQDKSDYYWIGTQNGIIRLNIKFNTFQTFNNSQSSTGFQGGNIIYSLMEDYLGKIWIATNEGLEIFDPDTRSFTHYKPRPGDNKTICDEFVVSLCEDDQKNVWIGTRSGVNLYDRNTGIFLYFSEKDGLPNNLTYEIIEDSKKNLWFATGGGLAMYSTSKKIFRTYTVEEGLQSTEFNLNAAYKSPDGEIFFGGMNGLNSFYPDSLSDNPFIPPVVVTGFEKIQSGQKIIINIEGMQKVKLNYNDYVFTISFASLDYTRPENNRFAYKMEGLMNEWVEIGTRNFVPFTNVPPGNYIFRIKGTNNDGVWNENGSSIPIIIYPPWWKSTIAYLSYFVLIILGIIFFIKGREHRIIHEKKVLEIKVKERTEEIQTQKERIEKAHKEITDSINAASRIQSAMLPQTELFNLYFNSYFILYSPRDVVSGDFYWTARSNHVLHFAVGDCTGHGVPGALVSMLAISLLNEIARNDANHTSSHILEALRTQIKVSLKQFDQTAESKEGLDIAFCSFDINTHMLDYAGAYNPVYIIRNKNSHVELIELKGNKNPIGIFYREKPFYSQYIELKKDDMVILFTDGFIDQFNGQTGEKFKYRRFKEILINSYHLPVDLQAVALSNELKTWKGKSTQIDDITVLGIRV